MDPSLQGVEKQDYAGMFGGLGSQAPPLGLRAISGIQSSGARVAPGSELTQLLKWIKTKADQ